MNTQSYRRDSLLSSLCSSRYSLYALFPVVAVLVASLPARVAAFDVCSDGPCTHEIMTDYGLELYLHDVASVTYAAEMMAYSGAIEAGAGIPDEYDPLYDNEGALVTITHFWDTDASLGTPMVLGVDDYPNAFNVAQALWIRALGSYAAGNKWNAYRYLGMITHFMADMTVPAHVKNDMHGPDFYDDDCYEKWMNKVDDGPGGRSVFARLSPAEVSHLETLGVLDNVKDEIDAQFLWLFLNTNQVADYFASDDYPGDSIEPVDPFVAGWTTATLTSLGAACAAEPGAGCPTTTERLVDNDTGIIPNNNDNDGDLSIIRKHSYMYGIRAIGALFALFERAVTRPILSVRVQQIRELGYEDTLGSIWGLDGLGAPDFFVGMVMGYNEKGCPSGCGYPAGAYLKNRDNIYRAVDGVAYPANVTRRDAFIGNQDKTLIYPNYSFGQSYHIIGSYVSGLDVVNLQLSVWDQDPNPFTLPPYSDDEAAHINSYGGSNVTVQVDLARCLTGMEDAVATYAGPNLLARYRCGDNITTRHMGDESEDVEVIFSVSMIFNPSRPEVTCGVADDVWHASDVKIDCTAVDNVSGLLSPLDAAFSLWTHVPPGLERDNVDTNSRMVPNQDYQYTAAGPIGGNKVDKKAPTITIVGVNGDNSYHVVTGANDAILDGFTITGGNADGAHDNNGGGMYNYNASPTVTNCSFENNAATYGGGMSNTNSSPTVTSCTFASNIASDSGGGMSNNDSSPAVTNCTFASNSAGNQGGGIHNVSSSPTVTNSILWGNTAEFDPQIYNEGSSPHINYSDVQGGCITGTGCTTDDTGNIDLDPLFADLAGGVLRLTCAEPASSCSPCIDQGDDAAAPPEDMDGNTRQDLLNVANGGGGYSDMGAFEFQEI